MEKEIVCTLEKEGFKAHYYPGTKELNKAIISVGAASCDEKTSIDMANFLRNDGWNVLVLGYYHWEGLSKSLCDVPIDYAFKAVKWLKEKQNIEKIAMYGVSAGASYTLCSAERISDISCVIACVPYDHVMEGTSGYTKRLNTASFSYQGKSLPYTKLELMDKGIIYWLNQARKAKGYGMSRFIRWGYDYHEQLLNPTSRIKVENMHADVLLLGVKDDDCWPSDFAVVRMEKLLKESNYPCRVKAHVYEKGSHALMDGFDSMSGVDKFFLRNTFVSEKKYPKECEAARQDSLKRILKFLEEWK